MQDRIRLTVEQRKDLIARYEAGETIDSLASRFSYSQAGMHHLLMRLGMKARRTATSTESEHNRPLSLKRARLVAAMIRCGERIDRKRTSWIIETLCSFAEKHGVVEVPPLPAD